MKTAISIPDPVFRRVEEHAQRLGLSRSEFLSRAAARWADELDEQDLTSAIDDALLHAGPDPDAEFLARAAQLALADDREPRG
ncbi:MAG: ribbon-helix-helix domain-containing protein [Pseudonocardia sp.]